MRKTECSKMMWMIITALFVVTSFAETGGDKASSGPTADVQQRYTPVPGGFEIRNGASEFMRPLYGWHGDDDIRQPKRSMPSTSDRPKVALKVFNGMRLDKKARGVLSFGDGTEDVTFRYVWGRAEYDLKGKGTVKMVALQGERPHVLRRAEARRTHSLHAPQGPDLQHVRGVRGFRAALLALDRR